MQMSEEAVYSGEGSGDSAGLGGVLCLYMEQSGKASVRGWDLRETREAARWITGERTFFEVERAAGAKALSGTPVGHSQGGLGSEQ